MGMLSKTINANAESQNAAVEEVKKVSRRVRRVASVLVLGKDFVSSGSSLVFSSHLFGSTQPISSHFEAASSVLGQSAIPMAVTHREA